MDGGEPKGEDEVEEEVRAPTPVPSFDVHVDGESDDEFEFIEIKEKIKEFIKENEQGTRITDSLINEAVRWRLNRNDCQNRGYVLDGYPKSIE